MTARVLVVAAVTLGLIVVAPVNPPATAQVPDPPVPARDSVGVVDVAQGYWWLRDADTGGTTSFYYGNPGDTPFAGDWDCDGVDTPGLYRQSDGYVYLRNSNSQGVADVSFFFGNPGDVPLAGDFNGDGCDTVSLYRPDQGRFYVINKLGSGDAGLGAAEAEFSFGTQGDVPFVGDFDGDGVDSFGMARGSAGLVYLRNSLSAGDPEVSFFFGDSGDAVLSGAWAGTSDAVALYRRSNSSFYLSAATPATGVVDSFQYGARGVVPVSGNWGTLPGGDAAPFNKPYLVSQFTTYHPAGQARNININLLADMIDGAVVLPGEVFSINDHVGERTEAAGFVRAGAIISGVVYCCDKKVNIGGGTSQFSTTLYNAVFFGAYEDVFHRPHSLYFTRYPVVREATLGFPGPDVKFRNDTAFPVTIRTEYTATSITVKLYGDNEGRSVTTYTVGSVSSKDGGEATVYRTIHYANGTSHTDSWTHRYRAKVSTDPEPPPPPPPPPPGPGLS